jgi:hypothetical protein
MKAIIKSVEWIKEYDTKFGKFHQHKITYDDKTAYYSSKVKEQKNFIPGKESEFVEELKKTDKCEWLTVKLLNPNGQNNYSKQVKKEQSRYSGFAVSYVKDLIIADKIKIDQWEAASKKIFQFMVDLDKTLEV